MAALRDLCILITKGTTPTTVGGKFTRGGINFVKSESLSYDGSIDETKFASIDEETHEKLKRSQISEGDILYSIAGVNLGKCGLAKADILPANTNQAVAIIRLDPIRACPQFVSYLLRNKSFVQSVLGGVAQSAQPNVNLADIGRFAIPNWPLDRQRAIAHILGSLDDKIALNRQMNQTLATMARALFKSWFVDFDPVRAKAEGRDPDLPEPSAALFPGAFDDSELGEVPKGWGVGTILVQAELLSGGTPKTDRQDYWDGDIPWATAKDVSQCGETFLVATERTISAKGLEESATQLIPAFSTVVVARGATTGRMVLFGREMAMNQTCYALASKTQTPLALHCHLSHRIDDLVHSAHGSVFDTITTSTFKGGRFVLAPDYILAEFEKLVSPIFGRILAACEESRTLAAVRDTLLPKLISGELRVKDAEKLVSAPDAAIADTRVRRVRAL